MFNTTFSNDVLAVDFTKVVETRNWLIEKGCEFTARFCTDDNNAEVVYFELHYAPAEVIDRLNEKFNPVKPEFRKWDEMSGELRVAANKEEVTTRYLDKFDCEYEMRFEGRVAVFTLWEAPARVIESLQQKWGVEYEPAPFPILDTTEDLFPGSAERITPNMIAHLNNCWDNS